jgi:hypothetical protein
MFSDHDDAQVLAMFEENSEDLKEVLRESSTFFSIVKGILQYAFRNSSGNVAWSRIPGYWTMFRANISKIMVSESCTPKIP